MEPPSKSHNLFQVFLRLRPPTAGGASTDRFLNVETPETDAPSTAPTHIRLNPPNDRRRAIEKFGFTRVFEEDAGQLEVFRSTGVASLVTGVLAPHGGDGTDALLATLGVTGSGKSHTILGSRTQRGLTQLALDALFRAMGDSIVDGSATPALEASIHASDASEATIYSAAAFIDAVYGDNSGPSRPSSRAPTPMLGEHGHSIHGASNAPPPRRVPLNRPTAFAQLPDVSSIPVGSDPSAQYAVLVSMYEVYNDRIFDLLAPAARTAGNKEAQRRRALLFKSTELSPDRKVVAGLRKVVCGSLQQALLVLEAGLHERRVAGTGSNSVSSRSHGFVCVEVKKRAAAAAAAAHTHAPWSSSTLTIVDLAGSERARDTKTTGATLAEAGKINESLMYLGQCLQMQSDATGKAVVPFRQCKLTELLFSNSFPSATQPAARRNPQRAVMIVTADPHGDFNATSQILRYSALAREITVPRIPSVTQTILASSAGASASAAASTMSALPDGRLSPPPHARSTRRMPSPTRQRAVFPAGTGPSSTAAAAAARTFSPMSTVSSDERITMEIAALEIARMAEEMDYLRALLEQEAARRTESEAHLLSATDRMVELEQEIREDCAVEYEQRLALEMARWKAGLDAEKERSEAHWDRKVEVMERLADREGAAAGGCDGDHDDKENVLVENLEQENERLRRELQVMRRELTARSPSKRRPLRERDDMATASLVASPSTTPVGTPTGTPTGGGGGGDERGLRQRMEWLRLGADDDDSTDSDRQDPAGHHGHGHGHHGHGHHQGHQGHHSPHGNASTRAARAKTAAVRSGSPKKVHKLSPRKWDVALDEDDLF